MAEAGYVLDEDGARRVASATRAVENSQLKTGIPPRPSRGQPPGREPVHVQITSTTATSGHYPGKLYFYVADTASFFDPSVVVWVVEPNGGTLATGTYYETVPTGTWSDGTNRYLVCVVDLQGGSSGGGGGSLTSGSATLGTLFNIPDYASAATTLSVSLASAGTYLLSATLSLTASLTNPNNNGVVVFDLYDSTNSITVPGSRTRHCFISTNSGGLSNSYASVCMAGILYTVNLITPATVALRAGKTGSSDFSSCRLDANNTAAVGSGTDTDAGSTSLRWVKIA